MASSIPKNAFLGAGVGMAHPPTNGATQKKIHNFFI